MENLPTLWYGCAVCGELRRYPFEAYEDRPGCRCRPAVGAPEIQNGVHAELARDAAEASTKRSKALLLR